VGEGGAWFFGSICICRMTTMSWWVMWIFDRGFVLLSPRAVVGGV
jgi:hypothetical protein